MYHYVRPIAGSRYPGIRGLESAHFSGQLDYLLRHYTPIRMEDLIGASQNGDELPPNAVLLTFDDGYLDHYNYVFPLLHERHISGAFYPSASAVLEHNVLDVNKLHFVLASTSDTASLVRYVEHRVDAAREQFNLESSDAYRKKYCVQSRYDSAEVIYVKRMIQHALPQPLRHAIVEDLFREVVTSDTTAFAEELYLNAQQLREMLDGGMHIGSHAYHHDWLGTLSVQQQEKEIESSSKFLSLVGASSDSRSIAYPYGSYNEDTLRILSVHGYKAALTTKVDIADLRRDGMLTLPRIDTNDLPRDGDAPPGDWTIKAQQGLG